MDVTSSSVLKIVHESFSNYGKLYKFVITAHTQSRNTPKERPSMVNIPQRIVKQFVTDCTTKTLALCNKLRLQICRAFSLNFHVFVRVAIDNGSCSRVMPCSRRMQGRLVIPFDKMIAMLGRPNLALWHEEMVCHSQNSV